MLSFLFLKIPNGSLSNNLFLIHYHIFLLLEIDLLNIIVPMKDFLHLLQ